MSVPHSEQINRRLQPALVLLLLFPGAALANNPPGAQTFLGFFALLIAIPLLTYIGGGAAILSHLQPTSRWMRVIRGLLKVFAVLVMIFFMPTSSTAALSLLAILVFAIYRGTRLIEWGVKAGRPASEQPAHVAGASRWRLISAGSLLIVAAVALTHMSVAFAGYYPSESRIAGDLMKLVTAIKEAGERNKGADGLPRYTAPSVNSVGSYQVGEAWYYALKPVQTARFHWHATEVTVAPDGKSFQAWAFPRVVPFWPWNHIMQVPSFYIDQTGQLRATWVSEPGMRCPPDAPVRAVVN